MDAATMTPAAKPVRERWSVRFICPFRKNTKPAPTVVPRNGRRITVKISGNIEKPPLLYHIITGKICKWKSQVQRGK
jgi:hypothetical protein